ncbi:serine/threonine-protein kinase [Streptomyces sp. WAC06614]|uniref:serine/threonine-protein kinase n=1 Tax=Streptomyces sp. WAC06614 TaxID=2487416 RepID=UPI000F7B33DC|nr:serine/threonine-protein kinase [Streptomyces sp. WAC06614]RSS62694.1 serine/threonine protein kinase [Streptomyces sp. WAC06614]
MQRIGGYLVERKLGEGGMGTVYLARSRGGRAVAVKVARPELAADPAFRERFRAEVAAARRVGGFHTASVVDADTEGDPLWLATAYVPGPTLAGRLAAEGPMDEPALRMLAAALAEALEAIHACGLVHRDLKPGNIVMAADGPRVLDFGIARAVESTRLTATGTAFGTPGYLAPEQALGDDVTGAADVFALGAVLVASAGGSAWGEGTPMGLMYRSVHEPPDLTAVPEALRPIVASCLAKDPASRPTPSALLDLLTDPDPAASPQPLPLDRLPTMPAATPPAPHTPPPFPAAGPAAPATPPHAPAVPAAGAGVPHQGESVPGPYGAAAVPQGTPPQPYAVPPVPATPPAVPGGGHTPPGGPVPAVRDLVIADRRNSVVVDATGIVFEIDGVEADFGWAELAGVTYGPAHRGNHLHIALRLTDGNVYTCQVNARRAVRLQEWLDELHRIVSWYLAPRLGVVPGPYGVGAAPYDGGTPGAPVPGPYGGFGAPWGYGGPATPGGFGPPAR